LGAYVFAVPGGYPPAVLADPRYWTRPASLCALVLAVSTLGCTVKSPEADTKDSDSEVQSATEAIEPAQPAVAARPGELAPMPDDPNAVIARVGELEVLRREFDLRYQPQADMLLARRGDGKIPDAWAAMQRRNIIGALVWSRLMDLEVARSGVDFEPAALVEQEADERRHIRDWESWLGRVSQTPEIRHQQNIDYLRERALIEDRNGPLAASEKELRTLYDGSLERFKADQELVRASHLLFAIGPREGAEKIQPLTLAMREAASEAEISEWEAQTLAHAQRLHAEVTAEGVDFNAFAKARSEGPGAFRGGDMGLFPRRQMVADYAEVVFGLEVGEVSQPLKSEKGYYVIKLFGRYQKGSLPFEAVRADLVRQVEGGKIRTGKASLETELGDRFEVKSALLDEAEAFKSQGRGKPQPKPNPPKPQPQPKSKL